MSDLPNNNDIIGTNKRLDVIISILLHPTKFQEANNKRKIALLSDLDLDNQEIAKLLDVSSGLVSKEKSVLKKERNKHE